MDKIIIGDALDALRELPSGIADTCVTSPPYYGLRDYGVDGQIGIESTPQAYIERLVGVFREVRRVLRDDGTLWINIGDSYAGSGKGRDGYFGELKRKDLMGVPWMLAFALRADGWYLRQDIIWHKPNPMPESVKDRCTKSHEYIFLLSKSSRYYFDGDAIAEPISESTKKRLSQKVEDQAGSVRAYGKTNGPMKACAPRYGGRKYTATPDVFYRTKSGNMYELRPKRNKRSVWTVSTKPFKDAHFAVYPDTLVLPCILAGSRNGGTVLDPFIGSGTTAEVAHRLGRDCIGIDINPEYAPLIRKRSARQ